MIVSFVGCPSSGKTTTSAACFAELKEKGIPAEWVPEAARSHIASIRHWYRLKPEEKPVLTDTDQWTIMWCQLNAIKDMSWSCGPRVAVISDASPLCSLLYMAQAFLDQDPACDRLRLELASKIPEMAKETTDLGGLFFYCRPVPPRGLLDPNRIHSYDESLKIDSRIPEVMDRWAPGLKFVELAGSSRVRLDIAMDAIARGLAAEAG